MIRKYLATSVTIFFVTPAWAQDHVPAGGSVQLTMADTDTDQFDEKNTIIVTGKRHTGEQVAPKGSVGILGDRDVLETPFSQTSYTDALIKNIQAKTFGEIFEANPSVTRNGGRFYQNDEFLVRGFPVHGKDISYDGLYGLASQRRVGVGGIARIDFLKGPNALLNGVPPNGSVGGAINIVPKRAETQPNYDFDADYLGTSNFGAHIDVGRRFGADDAYGARLNFSHRAGDVTLDGARERETMAYLSLDRQSDRLRVFANINYENRRNDGAGFAGWGILPGFDVPKAPDNRTNPTPPFTYTKTARVFGLVRAEYDIASGWTASLGAGAQTSDDTQFVTYGKTILDAAGDVRGSDFYRLSFATQDAYSYDAKLIEVVSTGPLHHEIGIAAYHLLLRERFRQFSQDGPALPESLYQRDSVEPRPVIEMSVAPSLFSTRTVLEGVAIADTISVMDNRVQFTAGVRRQRIKDGDLAGGVSYDKSATTPAFALLARLTPSLSVYGNLIQGLSEGPQAPDTAVNARQIFPPSKTRQNEVGAKFSRAGLTTTLALFDITQPSGRLDLATNIFNVDGDERHRGVELEMSGEPLKGVRLLGGATYIKPQLVKTEGGLADGQDPGGIPAWIITAGGEWDTPLTGVTLTGRYVYQSRRFIDSTNTQRIPPWSRVDLGGRYSFPVDGHLVTLRAQVTNVLDHNYWESVLFSGPPRTVSLSASVSF